MVDFGAKPRQRAKTGPEASHTFSETVQQRPIRGSPEAPKQKPPQTPSNTLESRFIAGFPQQERLREITGYEGDFLGCLRSCMPKAALPKRARCFRALAHYPQPEQMPETSAVFSCQHLGFGLVEWPCTPKATPCRSVCTKKFGFWPSQATPNRSRCRSR